METQSDILIQVGSEFSSIKEVSPELGIDKSLDHTSPPKRKVQQGYIGVARQTGLKEHTSHSTLAQISTDPWHNIAAVRKDKPIKI
jgi:hypothetical protein